MRCPRSESTGILCQVDNGSQKSNPDPVFVSCFSKVTNHHRFLIPFEALQIPNVLDGSIVNWMFILLLKMEFIRAHWNYRHSWRLAIDAYRVLKILIDKFIDFLQSFVDEQCSGQIQCEFRGVNLVFHGVTPCPLELSSYLEASYRCVPGRIFNTDSKRPCKALLKLFFSELQVPKLGLFFGIISKYFKFYFNYNSFADSLCSGKSTCEFRADEPKFHGHVPCPLELSSYLEASFKCIPGNKRLLRSVQSFANSEMGIW